MRRTIKTRIGEIYNAAADLQENRDSIGEAEAINRLGDLAAMCERLRDQLLVDDLVAKLETIKKVGVVNARGDGATIDRAIRLILEKRI